MFKKPDYKKQNISIMPYFKQIKFKLAYLNYKIWMDIHDISPRLYRASTQLASLAKASL